MQKDLVSIDLLTNGDVADLLALAKDLKAVYRHGGRVDSLKGKVLGMVFAKPSLRTRVSFEVAAVQLGGHAMYITHGEVGLGKREAVSDAARVLSRMIDGIMIRTFAHSEVEELSLHATIPVINGLTDLYHPCQALADLMTIDEHFGTLEGIRVAYIGDGNNVAHSLINSARRTPISLAIATPPGYEPTREIVDAAHGEIGNRLVVGNDPAEAVKGANVVYADVWASMGQEAERQERLARFVGFQVNDALVDAASPGAVVMHCLPAHRGEEITDSIMDGTRAIVFQQAENRLHLQRALLHVLMGTR
ncbi:ornithine carbamoyltransferase [Candidatus Fermentibacteria bacterium]|nr:ornithine carbamoyltransferase [Candidatus Fermentibacteria bacterium]